MASSPKSPPARIWFNTSAAVFSMVAISAGEHFPGGLEQDVLHAHAVRNPVIAQIARVVLAQIGVVDLDFGFDVVGIDHDVADLTLLGDLVMRGILLEEGGESVGLDVNVLDVLAGIEDHVIDLGLGVAQAKLFVDFRPGVTCTPSVTTLRIFSSSKSRRSKTSNCGHDCPVCCATISAARCEPTKFPSG